MSTQTHDRAIDDLISKSALCRKVNRSKSFIDGLGLPKYPYKKRRYYKESDYWNAIGRIQPEEVKPWECSKPSVRRISNTKSQSMVLRIEEARALISARMQKHGSPMNGGR